MRVEIPPRDCKSYMMDHDFIRKYGGKWNTDEHCYQFEQGDVEAYILVLDTQWRLVNE